MLSTGIELVESITNEDFLTDEILELKQKNLELKERAERAERAEIAEILELKERAERAERAERNFRILTPIVIAFAFCLYLFTKK